MAAVVGRISEVPPGRVVVFHVDGKPVAVANVEGKLFAFDDLCTHVGCSLAEGSLAGTSIICPCHGSVFDLTNGSVLEGPARKPLATYAVEAMGDELRVATEARPAPASGDQTRTRSVLADVPLFAGLDDASVESLEAFTFRKTFKAGEVIVEEGRTGNGLYVVLSGAVEVIKGLRGERPQAAATLGPGEPFGEMALLGDWRRSASVRALGEVECLGIDRWAFLAHLNRTPQLAIKLLQLLAQRLAQADERLSE